MNRDIKAIIMMLSSQAMINLGIIPDPVSKETLVQLEKAEIFIDLLTVLKDKTKAIATSKSAVGTTNVVLDGIPSSLTVKVPVVCGDPSTIIQPS